MKLRRIITNSVFMSIGVGLMDIENPTEPWSQEKADAWVRSMNKFIPFRDEVLLIGIKGAFKEIRVLKNLGRNLECVKAFELTDKSMAKWEAIRSDADWVADHCPPWPHVMVLDIFCNTYRPVPILPDCQKVALLSVSTENGEVDIVDIKDGGFTTPSWPR